MKIYTRTGDEGSTALFGGPRVSKAHLRIGAYGSVDELNASIGVARSQIGSEDLALLDGMLHQLQNRLFTLGADLATPLDARVSIDRVPKTYATDVEVQIDTLEEDLDDLKQFILPAGTSLASALHVARTVCRRAEREVVALAAEDQISPHCISFLNRVSDFLFVAARWANRQAGVQDEAWNSSV